MTFNSAAFIEFAALFFLGWRFVRDHKPTAYLYLIIASTIFYGLACWWFPVLLLATATLDFYLARAMVEIPSRKKAFLVASCVSNLGVLFAFKYLGLVAHVVNLLAGIFGSHSEFQVVGILVPVGISFYTFQSLSYVFDVYSGKIAPARSLREFLTIVSMFAHLIAGPIVRVSHILPQLQRLEKPTGDDIMAGWDLVAVGLFKKMVIADRLASYVDAIYAKDPSNGLSVAVAIFAFSFQIYFDFSGYTDIARGLARWLGIDFGLNFNHPYSATGFADFWSRWHISLSTWIRDYIYIPLGGNRKGSTRTYFNLWIAFLLSGIWHGANLTFLVWSAMHAVFISLEHLTGWPARLAKFGNAGRFVAWGVTFTLVSFAWVPFRATSIRHALDIYRQLFDRWDFHVFAKQIVLLILVGILFELWVLFGRKRLGMEGHLALSKWIIAGRNGALLASCLVFAPPAKAFIYFQF